MFCPNCGKQLADTARTCDACGESVYVGFAPDEVTVRVTPPVQPTEQQVYEQPPVAAAQQPFTPPPVQQPVPPQPAYVPYTPTATKTKKVGVARNLLAGIPAFLVVCLVVAASALMCMQSFFSVSTIKKYARSEIIPIMAEENILDFASTEIPEDALKDIYEIDGVQDMLANAVADVYENAVYGAENEVLSADTIIDVLKDNADQIEEISGYKLTDGDYDMIKEQFDKVGSEDLQAMVGDLTDELDVDKETMLAVEMFLSPATPFILLGIAAVLLVLMFLIRRFFMTTFIWGGVLALPGAIVPALFMVLANLVIDEISYDEVTSRIAVPYIETSLNSMVPVLIGFAVAGVAMIVLGIVLSIVQKATRK